MLSLVKNRPWLLAVWASCVCEEACASWATSSKQQQGCIQDSLFESSQHICTRLRSGSGWHMLDVTYMQIQPAMSHFFLYCILHAHAATCVAPPCVSRQVSARLQAAAHFRSQTNNVLLCHYRWELGSKQGCFPQRPWVNSVRLGYLAVKVLL